MTEQDIEKAEQELAGQGVEKTKLFQEPQGTILGMKLRPYSGWTCQLLEQIKLPLKLRIQALSKSTAHAETCVRFWKDAEGCTAHEVDGKHADACVSDWMCGDGCMVRWQHQQSTFWYLAAFLYIHTAPEEEVDKAAWDMDKLMGGVKDVTKKHSYEDILGTLAKIAEIVDAPTKVTNYETADKGTGPPRPNS